MHSTPQLLPITDVDMARFTVTPVGGRPCYYYIHYYLLHNYTHDHPTWPLMTGAIGQIKENAAKWFYLEPKDIDLQPYLDLYLREPDRFTSIYQHLQAATERAVGFLSQDLTLIANQELAANVDRYSQCFYEVSYVSVILRYLDLGLIGRFNALLSGRQDRDEALRLLSLPPEMTKASQEEGAVRQLAERIRAEQLAPDSPQVQEALGAIAARYRWLTCGYYNEPSRTREDYLQLLGEALGGSNHAAAAEARFRQDSEARAALLQQVDSSVRELAAFAAETSRNKDAYKFSINKIIYYAENLFHEIARRIGQDVVFTKSLTPEEMKILLAGGTIDEAQVAQRHTHSIIASFIGHSQLFIGAEADAFARRYLELVAESGREFRGRVASRGYGKGKAKVVRSVNEFPKVEQGDILVVSNTTPDYVPILRRVAAIVAEEGGLTAHVSVVSREFGIPCVVGIPRVTELIKDESVVEVDAISGVVKILEN
jgi:phosphohistidine swiveling domain-containing protein